MESFHVIKRPLLTEKGTMMGEQANAFPFEVDLGASKTEIRQAVEKLFEVQVTGVRTMIVRGKPVTYKRHTLVKKPWKKAIVTLAEGQSIEFI